MRKIDASLEDDSMSDRAQVTKYSASVLAGCYRCSPCSHQL